MPLCPSLTLKKVRMILYIYHVVRHSMVSFEMNKKIEIINKIKTRFSVYGEKLISVLHDII